MKKYPIVKYSLLSLLALPLTLISCTKHGNKESINPITYKSYEDQVLYVQNELKSIAHVIGKIGASQAGFYQKVRSLAENKFDGNSNVLIKTIVESNLIENKDFEVEIKSKLRSFERIGGHNYYP